MKRKLVSLGLAAALLASLGGCAVTTPATVGRIGEVEIPAGIYLLTQYNAYSTVANLVELGEGETTTDVKAVLAAEANGAIGDEEVTASGKEYLARLTLRGLEYYAAVETTFAELGGSLDEETIAAVEANADSLWETNGDLYAANGISEETLKNYLLLDEKMDQILRIQYGDDGLTPVADSEYTDFLQNECYYIDSIEFPLIDYNTYTFADEDTTADIEALAADCAKDLNAALAPAKDGDATMAAMTDAANTYLPQAFEAMGATFNEEETAFYAMSGLYTPSALLGYDDSEGGNAITDPLDEADGDWVSANTGMMVMVGRKVDPLGREKLEDLKANYDLLSEVKGTDLQNDLYAQGAALAHELDQGAMDTYKASNIKRSL